MPQSQTGEPQASAQMVALVDDEIQIVQVLQALLSFKGHASSVHASAESLLQALTVREGEVWLPDRVGTPRRLTAAVLDLNLPGMDGLDLATHLRRLQPQLRLVMITAALQDTLQERAQGLDMVVLSKPFTLEALEQALHIV